MTMTESINTAAVSTKEENTRIRNQKQEGGRAQYRYYSEVLSIAEAAEWAKMSRHIMDAIVASGTLPVLRVGAIGGKVLIMKSDLVQFLTDMRGQSLTDNPAQIRHAHDAVMQQKHSG